MTEIQLSSGSSSSATHHITQSSHTLNRRYVERPTNLAVEEAAKSASAAKSDTSSTPSRLVNLRVHAADLAKAVAETPQPPVSSSMPAIVPKVVELGSSAEVAPSAPLDLTQIVPPEDTSNEPISLAPVTAVPPEATIAPEAYAQPTITSLPATLDNSDALAMNIAADYAAASLGVSTSNPVASDSIDTVAQVASEAIAAIRTATDPEEIAKQIASLQDFAATIKATSAAPEMVELSDTIEKFVSVAMKSTTVQEEVKKQTKAKSDAKAKTAAKASSTKPAATRKIATTRPTTTRKPAATRTATRPTATRSAARPTAARRNAKTVARPQLAADNDQALRKALRSVAAMDEESTASAKPVRRPVVKRKSSGKRLVLAFFCAAVCVAAVVYFVGTNIPDISVKVAAMQTGIEASYPSYVPRDYSLNDISSEEGKITLTFKGPDRSSFTLTEEKSSWDSNTLLRNYVEPTWQSNYITTHEQGITIYISGTNAAWVNGGVLYKITATGNNLTKKQLRNIVISM